MPGSLEEWEIMADWGFWSHKELKSGRTVYRNPVTFEWGQWIAGLREWDLFGAMTYDQRRPAIRHEMILGAKVPRPVARDRAIKDFKHWHSDAEGALHRRIDYVAALEFQKNGFPHFHPLLAMGGLQDGDIALIGQLWYRRFGWDQLAPPRVSQDVAEYAAKYLVKDFETGDVLLSPRLHRLSLQPPLGRQSGGPASGGSEAQPR